jgi:hypothetical protein
MALLFGPSSVKHATVVDFPLPLFLADSGVCVCWSSQVSTSILSHTVTPSQIVRPFSRGLGSGWPSTRDECHVLASFFLATFLDHSFFDFLFSNLGVTSLGYNPNGYLFVYIYIYIYKKRKEKHIFEHIKSSGLG